MKFPLRLILILPLILWRVDICHAQPKVYVVMLVHRVINTGKVESASVDAHCILPADNQYQDLLDMQIDPEPGLLQIDGEGQKAVKVSFDSIEPGRARTIRALVWVKPKTVQMRLTRKPDGVEPLLTIQREGHLSDGYWLQLDKVRPIAEKAVKGKSRDLDKARALYNYMFKYCRYNIDRKEITADEVLSGVPASCSELAITFVAMCRSVEIPARLVNAYVNRGGSSPSIDWQLHRWVEFFAEDIGWVPVDPTNRINNRKKSFFGRQEGKYLAVVDDGVPLIVGPDPAWTVFGIQSKPQKGVTFEIGRSAVWRVSTNRQDEANFFKQACEQLKDPDPVVRLKTVKDWQREKQPLRMAFFLESLFDDVVEVRKAAVDGLGNFKEAKIILPLMRFADGEQDAGVKEAILDLVRLRLADKDTDRRVAAIGELSKSRTDDALTLLADIGDDPEFEVRKKAAHMLYKFGDKPAVHKAYRRLTNDPDDYIRIVAALRWSRVGTPEALSELAGHLTSKVRWDRERALAELIKHTRDDFGFNPRSSVNSDKNVEAVRKFEEWIDGMRNKDKNKE
ncbi:MAG: transglutaminase domain-containing protein [Planctomycetota bacterium]|jgi:hypothetical protein